MKRLILATLVICTVCILSAVPALAGAAYTYNITISNTATSALTSFPWITSVNNTGLVAQGYLSTSGLDAAVMDGSTALPTMVTNNSTLFVDSLSANQSKIIQYTTGNSPATSMPIIVGNNGYLTTPYNAALDLGAVFRVDVDGFIDPAISGGVIGTCGDVTFSENYGTLSGEIDEAGNEVDFSVANAITVGGVYDISLAGDGSTYTLSDNNGHGQSFPETTGVPDNEQGWTWDESNVMPYINCIKIQTAETTAAQSVVYAEEQGDGQDFIEKLTDVGGTLTGTMPQYALPGGYSGYPHSICTDGQSVYILATNGVDSKVIQVNGETMTATRTLTLDYDDPTQRWPDNGTVMVLDRGYLYLIDPNLEGYNGYIDKIDTGNMTIIAQGNGGGYLAGGCVQALACYGGNLYVIFDGEGSDVVEITESDLSYVQKSDSMDHEMCDIWVSSGGGQILYVRTTYDPSQPLVPAIFSLAVDNLTVSEGYVPLVQGYQDNTAMAGSGDGYWFMASNNGSSSSVEAFTPNGIFDGGNTCNFGTSPIYAAAAVDGEAFIADGNELFRMSVPSMDTESVFNGFVGSLTCHNVAAAVEVASGYVDLSQNWSTGGSSAHDVGDITEFNGNLYGLTRGNIGHMTEDGEQYTNSAILVEESWNSGTNSWNTNWTPAAAEIDGLCLGQLTVYNGHLYASGYWYWGDTGDSLFELEGSNWVGVAPMYDSFQVGCTAMSVYNGQLFGYYLADTPHPSGMLLEWNGTNSWTEVALEYNSGGHSDGWLVSPVVLNGNLYAASVNYGDLLEWNGTNAWTLAAAGIDNWDVIDSLAVYDGNIYAAVNENSDPNNTGLFEYSDGAWVMADMINLNSDSTLEVFDGSLVMVAQAGATTYYYVWDGYNLDLGTTGDAVDAVTVFNNWLTLSLDGGGLLWNMPPPKTLSEILKYQPDSIIQDTDLPNLDDGTGATDGVITWGSNPSGTAVTAGSFQPTTPTQYNGNGNGSAYGTNPGSTINLTNPIAPAQLYTELDTSKIPFGTAIDDILNAGGIPRALWWFPFLYLGAIITGGLVYDATQRTGGQGSVLAMAITILVIQTLFGLMGTVGVSGMIPLWSPILIACAT